MIEKRGVMWLKKKMGRPTVPDYRKRVHRFSRIEDGLKEVMKKMKDENDKKLIEEFLNQFRTTA